MRDWMYLCPPFVVDPLAVSGYWRSVAFIDESTVLVGEYLAKVPRYLLFQELKSGARALG